MLDVIQTIKMHGTSIKIKKITDHEIKYPVYLHIKKVDSVNDDVFFIYGHKRAISSVKLLPRS
jgi:hypothetical protein